MQHKQYNIFMFEIFDPQSNADLKAILALMYMKTFILQIRI